MEPIKFKLKTKLTMKTKVEINWDKPEQQDWLCAGNIQAALSAHCTNTKFEVKELDEITGSESVYGFCAWLTTRKEKTIMSSKSNAAIIADLIQEFCNANELTDPRDNWTDFLKHPK